MAIADVYDALVSVRPYKKAFSTDEAKRIIEEGMGSHFDPSLVGVFLNVADKFADVVKENAY
jgi:putative two-component system response regulator